MAVYKLLAILAILTAVAICWPQWEDKPLGDKSAQAVAKVHAGDEVTPVAGYRSVIQPEEYAPDTDHYWMQPWYLLIGFSVAVCIFGSIWWLRREGWI